MRKKYGGVFFLFNIGKAHIGYVMQISILQKQIHIEYSTVLQKAGF